MQDRWRNNTNWISKQNKIILIVREEKLSVLTLRKLLDERSEILSPIRDVLSLVNEKSFKTVENWISDWRCYGLISRKQSIESMQERD